ncbi:MAG: VanZ family protein [Planctomycetota bacterium]
MRSSRSAWFACLALIPCYWAAATWPFAVESPHWRPNTVTVGSSGANFETNSRLVGDGATIVRAARAAGAMEVALRVQTADPQQGGPARIVELGIDHERANLTIGQDHADLVVRVRRTGSDPSGTPPLVLPDLFALDPAQSQGSRDITLEIEAARLAVRCATTGAAAESATADVFSAWDPDPILILGDSPVGERGWRGRIELARITAGTQVFELLGPSATRSPSDVLWLPARLRRVIDRYGFPPLDALEVLVNVLGFLPIGWLAVRAGCRRVAAVLLGLAVSVSMEVAQVFFAERIPAATDLLANTLGAWIGAWIAQRGSGPSPTRVRSS